MKKKIIIIICYFGPLPEHINLWLKSCSYNMNIDFILFTDQKLVDVPLNVKVISTKLDQIKERAQEKLNMSVSLNTPYKLCDYKVMYGLLFEEYISGYDFWGYCDLDQIFGDLEMFLSDKILEKFDKIYQLGHLTLIKNTKENNNAFKLKGSHDYKKVFSNERIYIFDEVSGIQKIFKHNNFKTYISRDYADISPDRKRFCLSNNFLDKDKIKNNNYNYQLFYWQNGKVYRAYYDKDKINYDEFNYIHFQKRKFIYKTLPDNVNSFFITNQGFIEKTKDEITIEDINKYNKYNFLEDSVSLFKSKLKKFLIRIKYKVIAIKEEW